jgi:hypothetical protein
VPVPQAAPVHFFSLFQDRSQAIGRNPGIAAALLHFAGTIFASQESHDQRVTWEHREQPRVVAACSASLQSIPGTVVFREKSTLRMVFFTGIDRFLHCYAWPRAATRQMLTN